MKKQVTVGVVGAGRIGQLHINNMREMVDVKLKTVSDIFADKLESWFQTSGVENLTKDYQDILDDPEIDAVLICSSTDTHIPIIKEAAAKGKHIFCEKPISFSDEETLEGYEAVNKAGVKFQLGFNRRYDRNFNEVKQIVEEGGVGDLHILKITSRDPEPPPLDYVKRSGGIFMDMAIHDFDMARFITGSEVEEVFVQGAVLINPEIAPFNDVDTAITTLKFANGALGIIDNSRQAAYGYDQRLEAFGAKGLANVNNKMESTVDVYSKDGMRSANPQFFFLERYNDAYIQEMNDFIQAVRNDTDVKTTYKDGIMAQRIAKAAKESLKIGQSVKVVAVD